MFGQRPTFGSTSTSFGGFGTNTQSTGFGGTSTFGRPAFGTPVSNQNQTTTSTPFGAGTTSGKSSIFGSNQPSTGGLFGSSQPTGFGSTGTGFGGGGGLFGSSNTQSNTSGGLFGSSTSTSGFNANQKGPFSFGTTTTNSGTGTNLFGTSNTGTNLFSAPLGQSNGTVIKYNPVTGTDTMTRGGTTTNIQTKIEVITAMKEYENRSLEELRVEDYLASRKGPQQQQQGFGFGQMSQQNKFGMNQPATSSNWLSGSTTGGTGLFGAKPPENKSLFGTNQNTGFGTSTSGGGGLFGSSNPSPFGQSTTAPSTGFSFGFSFGQGTSTTPLFGQSKTSTQHLNQQGGLFGTQKTAFGSANTGTGLFSNKTTGTGFTGFGNTSSSSSPFGATNTNTTGGLFGSNNQNKTGFSLGTSSTGFGTGASTFGTGSLFGSNTNQPKSGALTFGTSGGFGTNTSTGFSFSQPNTGGGGLFGNTQNTGGGLFGNTSSNFNTGSNFGSGGNTFGMNTMQPNTLGNNLNFGNPSAPNVNNNNINNLIKALTHNPFGYIFSPQGCCTTHRIPTYVLPSGSVVNNVKPKPIGSNRISSNLTDDTKKSFLFVGLDDRNESTVEDPFKIKPFPNVKRLNLKVFKNAKNNAVNGNSSANGQNTATNSIINGNLNMGMSPSSINHPPTSPGLIETPTSQGTLTPLHDNSPTPDIIKGRSNIKRLQLTNKNALNDTLAELNPVGKYKSSNSRNDSGKNDLDASECNKENTNITIYDPPSLDDLSDLPNDHIATSPHPAGIKLSRIGYYTMPSFEDLKEMVDPDGNCLVENFTIGRYGYGNICFQGISNVTGLDLDSIVFIVRKEVEVYPEGVNKPPVGEELNKPAFITLDCVWPVDKTTHEVIKSQERLEAMGWSQYLEKQCMKMGASFVEYRPETGSWVFKHFSKYGLQDDESDASSAVSNQVQQTVGDSEAVTPKANSAVPPSATSEDFVHTSSGGDLGTKPSLTFASGFPAALPMIGTKTSQSQGPPAVGLMSPPQFQGSQFGTEPVVNSSVGNSFLDGTTVTGPVGNYFSSAVEEGNEEPSFCPLSPSAERITLSSKVPVRAIQSLKSQLFFSDLDNEVSPEDDYVGFGPSKERSEKRELFGFGEEVTGPSEALGKATVVPVVKSSSKKLFTGDESMLNDLSTTANDITKTSSLFLESAVKEKTVRKTYSPTLQEPTIEESEIVSTGKSMLRDPKTEYQLINSVPDPYFELGKEETSHLQTKIPYKDSLAYDYSKGIADAGAFMGRSFRVGWGPCLTLVHGGLPLGLSNTAEVNFEDEGEEEYQPHEPIYLFDREAFIFKSAAKTPELSDGDTELNITSKGGEELNEFPSFCHYFLPEEGIHLLHELVLATANLDEKYYKDTKLSTVFQLCAALWGKLDFYSPDSDGDSEYALEQARKEALSVWLEEVSETLVEIEAERALSSETEEAYLDAVFSYLTVLQISRACEICLENGDDHLALLLTQACLSDEIPRNIMKEQLKNWAWSGIDAHMSTMRLALYTLISGKATHESSQGMINTCFGLDWRRCLALHMFVLPTTASVSEVLHEYEKAAGKIHSKNTNDDVCYQLLKLYVDRFHPLDTLLETSAITSDPLDVTTRRRKEILELLTRHLLVEGEKESSDPFYIEKEHFLLNENLGYIKPKPLRPKSSGLVDEEAWYLIKSRNYNEAHKLILETIAPNAIINEDHEYLLSYLNEFEDIDTNEMVVDWQNGGGIYRAYLEVVQQVNELKESQYPTASKVEKLQPRLMALCLRLNNLKCPTAVHRLCKSEISRMVISVLRALLSEDSEGIRVLAQQVSSLPLTHECALEELGHITHQYLTTISRETVPMETT
ncbi:Nuclear pore complex protein Nup98-Nup96 [Armadillidium vulgare]|nr:Nuclear pore complex protein Nup98-Nup96 [Armadillidium vulgare]